MMINMVKAAVASYISEYYPCRCFCREAGEAFFAGRFRGKGDAYRSFLLFDVNPLQRSRQLIAEEYPVYLRLSICRNEVKRGAVRSGLYRVLSPWQPDQISWEQQPRIELLPAAEFYVPSGWMGPMLLDLNRLVSDWLDQSIPNHGFMIKGNEEVDSLVAFNSSIYGGPWTSPVLFVAVR